MDSTDTSHARIDSDQEAFLEKFVFDRLDTPVKLVLGDTVQLSGKSRGGFVDDIDAYVLRHAVIKDKDVVKALRQKFASLERLKNPHGPVPVPGIPVTEQTKDSLPIVSVAGCKFPYFEDIEVRYAPRVRLTHFNALLTALADMHRHGIVHGNIHEGAVRKETEDSLPRLCDMALHGGKPTVLPETSLIYHSSELRSSMVPDVQSDIYAAGMLGYRMLVGPMGPTLALTASETVPEETRLLSAVRRGPERAVAAEFFEGLSPPLAQKLHIVLARMVGAPGHTNGYKSVDEVLSALDMGNDESLDRGPGEPPAEAKSWNRTSAMTAGALAIFAASIGAFAYKQSQDITALDTANGALISQSNDLNTRLDDASAQIQSLNGTLDATQATLAETEAKLSGVEDELATTQAVLASVEGTLETTEARLVQTQSDLSTARADIAQKTGEVQELNSLAADTQAALTACTPDLTRLADIRSGAPLAPVLDAIQARIASEVDTASPTNLTIACAEAYSRLSVLYPGFADVGTESAKLSSLIAEIEAAPDIPGVVPVDTSTALAILEESSEFGDAVTPEDLLLAADGLRQEFVVLSAARVERHANIIELQNAVVQAYSASEDGLQQFLPAGFQISDNPHSLDVQQTILEQATRNAARALGLENRIPGAFDLPKMPALLDSLRSTASDSISSEVAQLLAAIDSGPLIGEADALALEPRRLLASVGDTASLLEKRARLNQAETLYQGALMLAGFTVERDLQRVASQLANMRSQLDNQETRGIQSLGEQGTAAFAAARRAVDLVEDAIEARDVRGAEDLLSQTQEATEQAEVILRNAEGRLETTERQRAALLSRADIADLASFTWSAEGLSERFTAILTANPPNGALLGDQLSFLAAGNAELTEALSVARRDVDLTAASVKQVFDDFSLEDTEGAIDRYVAALESMQAGRYAEAQNLLVEAGDLFAKMNAAVSAPREITIGFSSEDFSTVSSWSIGPDMTKGALLRKATVTPFALDQREALFEEVITWARAQGGNVLSSLEEPTKILLSSGTSVNWVNRGPSALLLAQRYGGSAHALGLNAILAEAYCRSQGKRLPTEAEWEYMASGGGERIFSWDGPLLPSDWFEAETTMKPRALNGTISSPEGLQGLSGGAREWVTTEDGYALKGGSFRSKDWLALSASARLVVSSDINGEDFGVRCASDLERWP